MSRFSKSLVLASYINVSAHSSGVDGSIEDYYVHGGCRGELLLLLLSLLVGVWWQ